MKEALSAVFVPIRLRKILGEACESAGIASVPEAPISLRVFVEGALFSVLARHLGLPTALQLNEQIRSALTVALKPPEDEYGDVRETQEVPTSDVRESGRETTPGPRVLVVTQASLVVFLLQDIFGDAIEVLPVSGEKDLSDRLLRFGGQTLLIVIDRRHPCVGPGAARLLRSDLSESSTVVWWGAGAAEQAEVELTLLGGPRYVPTDQALPLADLGQLCLSAVDPISE